jgi:hypothetical protein
MPLSIEFIARPVAGFLTDAIGEANAVTIEW